MPTLRRAAQHLMMTGKGMSKSKKENKTYFARG